MPYEKVGKNEPVCIADEVPFDIPESWEWVRLEAICTKLVDGDHNPPKGCSYETAYVMVSSTNINDDCIVELEKVRYLEKNIFDKENERTNAATGDIFFTSVGSLGRSCVYEGGLNICFQRSVSVIHTLIFNYYLKYCLDSAYIQQKIVREATGTAQKGFYLNQLALLLIPIPPIKEQHRIVSKYLETVQMQKEYYKTNETLDVLNSRFPATLKNQFSNMLFKENLFPKTLPMSLPPFCWSVFAQKKNSLSKRAKSNVTSMNRSFSDGIILIMRRLMELNAVSMMSCHLKFPKVGNGYTSFP